MAVLLWISMFRHISVSDTARCIRGETMTDAVHAAQDVRCRFTSETSMSSCPASRRYVVFLSGALIVR